MLANRTLEYKRFARRRDAKFSPLSTAGVRTSLDSVRQGVSRLGIVQEKHCMPSFASRRRRGEEIDKAKRAISDGIQHAERMIDEAVQGAGSRMLAENMHGYFSSQLRAVVHDYRSLQQGFLKSIDVDEEAEQDCENEGNMMLLENVKDLRKSIYDLTSVLLDMRMAVGRQSLQIDRLDFYVESTNVYLEGANSELEKIPGSHRRVKDKVMYSLLLVSIVLVIMSMAKMARGR